MCLYLFKIIAATFPDGIRYSVLETSQFTLTGKYISEFNITAYVYSELQGGLYTSDVY